VTWQVSDWSPRQQSGGRACADLVDRIASNPMSQKPKGQDIRSARSSQRVRQSSATARLDAANKPVS
jgi:hypothetical protein